jgi:hypothetical protein
VTGGLDLPTLVRFAREARAPVRLDAFVGVSGVLARELAGSLAAGGRPGLVRIGPEEGEAVHVRVLGGAPTPDDLALLRAAARRDVPVVVVQAGAWSEPNPYVPADRVVTVAPGHGFPVDEIARTIVAAAPDRAAGVAAFLPVLRPAAERAAVQRAAVRAAALVLRPGSDGPDLPRLSLLQARMLGELRQLHVPGGAAGRAETPAAAVAGELALPILVGLASRFLVRRLEAPAPARAAVAGAASMLLGLAAPRIAGLTMPAAHAD